MGKSTRHEGVRLNTYIEVQNLINKPSTREYQWLEGQQNDRICTNLGNEFLNKRNINIPGVTIRAKTQQGKIRWEDTNYAGIPGKWWKRGGWKKSTGPLCGREKANVCSPLSRFTRVTIGSLFLHLIPIKWTNIVHPHINLQVLIENFLIKLFNCLNLTV